MPRVRITPPWFEKRGIRRADFGRDLQGLGNRQTVHVRAFKGASLGPANRGRKLSADERNAIEAQMRADGKL